MKLALVTQHFAPHFEGGTEAVVRAQARELAALGHEVSIVSGSDRPLGEAARETARVDGLQVTLLPRRHDEPYDLILERPRLLRHVVAACEGADLVHVHHWSTLDNRLVRTLAEGGRPVVVTLHDHFVSCPRFFRIPPQAPPPAEAIHCPPPGELEPCVTCVSLDAPLPAEELRAGLTARNRALGAELAAAERLVVPSRAHAERIEATLGDLPRPIEVVPSGLGQSLTPAPPPAAPRPLRVLHLGHRSELKGTLDLVQALASLPPSLRSQVHLLCLGSEVEPGFDQRLREAAGGIGIEFGGAYDVAALSDLLAARGGAHLAAFPSRAFESYGLVALEALALGLPCLVSDRGALPERLTPDAAGKRPGRVLPAADPAAWSAAFAELLAETGPRLSDLTAALPRRLPSAADAARHLDRMYAELLTSQP